MRPLRGWFVRLGELLRKSRRESELSAEMESHLQLHIEDNLRSGMTREEARRRALLKLGGIEQTKETYRDRRGLPFLETSLRDLRYAARVLRKNFGFTCIVVFTLTLGIGASTAIFSVLESQLWRPLPFPDSERLVDVHVVLRENPHQWDVLPNSVYRPWCQEIHSLEKMGAYDYPRAHNLTADGTSERVAVMPVTASLFDTLEVPLERGRNFLPEEETTGRDHVAILSHALWQNRFGSDTSVIGKPITIDGQPHVVIGIASPKLRFEYIREPDIYTPLALDPAAKVMRNTYIIGRLARGVSLAGARAELDGVLQRQLQAEHSKQEDSAAITNLRVTWTEFSARGLYFYAGAIALVLLIACVNNAGLLLARGLSRQREFALRATLGANRSTLIRQSLAESLLLSAIGGVAGTVLGLWGSGVFGAFWSEDALPRHTAVSLDVRVLLFVLGVSIFSAVLMGTMPAIFSSRVDVNEALRKGASGLSAGRSQHRTRNLLVAVEVCLALVLLFGAGLFLTSLVREEQAPRGFDAPGALMFRVALRGEKYEKPEQQRRYFRALNDQVHSLPGVQAVTLGSGLPLTGSAEIFGNVNIAGRPPLGPHGIGVIIHAVEPNFFDVLHIHLLAGRPLSVRDAETSPHVAVINRNAARTIFGSEDPLGKVLEFIPDERRGVPAEAPVQIVGVSENTQEFGANEIPFEDVYIPFSQHPTAGANIVVASGLPRGALLGAIRDAAYALDKDQPLYDVKTVDQLIGESLRGSRFNAVLVGCLAAVALALVSVGIFGVVAYFVQQRTQEFGIRIALGASPAHVLRQAIGRSYRMGVVGLVCGVGVALAIGRILGSALYLVPHEHVGMLYGVKLYDPLSMLVAGTVLLVVLFLASFIPARRAMRVDPMVALRYE